jgi:NADH-quinone oxidoreductase subunit M
VPLSVLIWLPVAAGLAGALLPPRWAGRAVLAAALVDLGLAIGYVVDFSPGHGQLQFVTDRTWIAELGIHYKLGLDGLNVYLVLMTALLWAGAVAAANLREWERPRLFYFHLALAESAVLGAFTAQDLALFVGFFDLMLIPFYFLVGAWGRGERVRATTKLVIYTLAGSLLMLAAAVALGVTAAQGDRPLSFAISDLVQSQVGTGAQEWIFVGFAAAFLVKMPLFPLHGWMPDGYRAMPLPVLAVFSAVLSKVAAYGFLRIVLPTLPAASVHWQTTMLVIAVVSILYGSLMAISQDDARLIVGFSSMAQLGFIVLGIFSLRPAGAQGALLQMVNHGLVVVPLFLIVGLLAARAGGSEDVRDMGGIAFRAPVLAALFLIVAFATLAMPGSANFVGEFYILLGTFQSKLAFAAVAFAGVALASVYMLRAFIRTVHNRPGERVQAREIGRRDALIVVPLVAAIVALAVYPQAPLHRSEGAVRQAVAPTTREAEPAGGPTALLPAPAHPAGSPEARASR